MVLFVGALQPVDPQAIAWPYLQMPPAPKKQEKVPIVPRLIATSATVTMLEASPQRIVAAREQPQRIVDFRQHVLNLTSGVDIRPHDFKGALGAAGSGGAPWQAPTAFVWVHEDPTGAKHTRVAKRARRCSSSVGNSSDGGGSSSCGGPSFEAGSLVVVECEAGSAGRGKGRRTWPTGAYAATITQPPDAAGLVHLHFEAATSGQVDIVAASCCELQRYHFCYCNQPGAGRMFLCCECDTWVHSSCEGMAPKAAAYVEKHRDLFVCRSCKDDEAKPDRLTTGSVFSGASPEAHVFFDLANAGLVAKPDYRWSVEFDDVATGACHRCCGLLTN